MKKYHQESISRSMSVIGRRQWNSEFRNRARPFRIYIYNNVGTYLFGLF